MLEKKKTRIIIMFCIALFVFGIIIKSLREESQIKSNRVYVLAKRYYPEKKISRFSFYYYNFEGKNYKFNLTGYTNDDSLILIEISSLHPDVSRVITEVRVPEGIGVKDMPESGWKKIPERFKKNKNDSL